MTSLTIACFAAVLAASGIAAQQPPASPLARFIITIETGATEVFLTCDEGCEWPMLRFPLDNIPTMVDGKGIVRDDAPVKPKGEGFLLAVGANGGVSDEGMDVECKRGCAWQGIAFSPRTSAWVMDECLTTPKKLWKPTDLPCAERRLERERGPR